MDAIRFDCPCCGIHLKFPAGKEALSGPCPNCSEEITGPDPITGASARRLHAVEAREPELPSPASIAPVAPSRRESEGSRLAGIPLALAACVCFALLAFAWGFIAGKNAERESSASSPRLSDSRDGSSPKLERLKPETSPPTRSASPPQPRSSPPPPLVEEALSEPPEAGPILGPEATLMAFLEAPDAAGRAGYVIYPEQVREEMERWAGEREPGPISTTRVSLREAHEQHYIFTVQTAAIPGGFPVAVVRNGQAWRVNWATFVEFHDDRFSRFASEDSEARGTFHLIVRPIEGEDEKGYFNRYRLTPPMPGRAQTAYVRKAAVPHARLTRIFENQMNFPPELHDDLMSGDGIPLVLDISSKTVADGRSYLEIEDVISIGWGSVAE